MTFDQEAKSVATSLPDDYQPAIFTNSALQCSSVCSVWFHFTYSLVLLIVTVNVFIKCAQYCCL